MCISEDHVKQGNEYHAWKMESPARNAKRHREPDDFQIQIKKKKVRKKHREFFPCEPSADASQVSYSNIYFFDGERGGRERNRKVISPSAQQNHNQPHRSLSPDPEEFPAKISVPEHDTSWPDLLFPFSPHCDCLSHSRMEKDNNNFRKSWNPAIQNRFLTS